jgi:copper chaperone CopZ
MSKDKKLMGATVISAIATSLCCITPVLALMAGTGGIASSFDWIGPFRPYLMAFTIMVLGLTWYIQLRPKTKQEIACDCPKDSAKFLHGKKLLLFVTVLSGLILTFPYYSHLFYPRTSSKEVVNVKQADVGEALIGVEGMTCESCEAHIESEVNTLEGIISVKADYQKGITLVTYDTSKVDLKAIKKAILQTGYKIIE